MKRRRLGSSPAEARRSAPDHAPPPPPYPAVPLPGTEAAEDYFQRLYVSALDFRRLAVHDPALAPFVRATQLNFGDPAAVMQLSKSLLKVDFGLTIVLPEDRLCPPIPNRHNYILWLKMLLDTSSSNGQIGDRLLGLDIGTGASCIYPLLASVQREWSLVATDVDDKNLAYAARNIEMNGLQDRIRLASRQPADELVPLDALGLDRLDFVMTNPPFYASVAERADASASKSQPPSAVCTGAVVEMVTPGGELGFVGRLLDESLVLRRRVRWYTAMVGKLASLHALVQRLHHHQIRNYAVTQFVQGAKTRRWAIGWTFVALRPSQAAARGIRPATAWGAGILPPVVEVDLTATFTFTSTAMSRPMHAPTPAAACDGLVPIVCQRICDVVSALELVSWHWHSAQQRGTGRAAGNVWSRASRRRRERGEPAVAAVAVEMATASLEGEETTFGFAIRVDATQDHLVVVGCRWLEGHDPRVFDSFRGFLQSSITTIPATPWTEP